MTKSYLLAIALFVPVQGMSIEQDSVYTWGEWSNGLQPAAGPVAKVTPPPVKTPNINFRPNENAAFSREAILIPNIAQNRVVTGFSDRIETVPVQITPPSVVLPPPPPPGS